MSILRRISVRIAGWLAVVVCACSAVYWFSRHQDFADGGYRSIRRTPVAPEGIKESTLPPGVLLAVREKRRQAWDQLDRCGREGIFAKFIHDGLWNPAVPVAIVRVEESAASGYPLSLRLRVEKVLRGSPPDTVSAEYDLYSFHTQRVTHFKPEVGMRVLASLSEQDRHTSFFYGILNLDDPKEAAWLPQAAAVVSLDEEAARKGPRVYEEGLRSPFPAVREVAMPRLIEVMADRSGDPELGSAFSH